MIIYASIAKGSLILCEYTEADGDFPQLVRKVLLGLKKSEAKQLYSKDEYVFCILSYLDYRFVCMIHRSSSKEKGFLFLDALKQEYLKEQENSDFSNGRFAMKISSMMTGFRMLNDKDALDSLEETVETINDQAINNLRSMIEREVRLEILVKKTNELAETSDLMYYNARKVRKALGGGQFRIGCKLFVFGFCALCSAGCYLYLSL